MLTLGIDPGLRFGRLTVLSRDGHIRMRAAYRCQCDCGQEVRIEGYKLRKGHTRSCGCLKRERTAVMGHATRKHGHWIGGAESPTYQSWRAMVKRCTQPTAANWKYYGGRGIRVCARWREGFEAFLADMGERPPATTLDRYPDNDGNYESGNCRWATPKQQAQNRRQPTVAA